MFGWELPPYNSGGLGTACLGLTKELVPKGINVRFVVPRVFGNFPFDHMPVLSAADYSTPEEVEAFLKITDINRRWIEETIGYGNKISLDEDLVARVEYFQNHIGDSHPAMPVAPSQQAEWYGYQAAAIARRHDFDLIHCHEWMTYYCGINAKKVAKSKGKEVPFVAQVHATEIDRGGVHGNKAIMDIERRGFHEADRIVAVSHYTKNIVHKHYDIPLNKISVVHNGIHGDEPDRHHPHALKRHYKLVLFMGRITRSKGPDYFLKLAKAVTSRDDNVKFIMVGSGDMEKQCIEQSAKMGLTGKVLFSPFLRGKDVDRAYQMADLFIMPSVSEPFGLVALESIKNGVPAIISKQSGVAEVSDNLVKLDFWDIDAMEKAVFELLYSPGKAKRLTHTGQQDLLRITWEQSAGQLHNVYQDVLKSFNSPILQPVYA